mmetsp:Transcript_15534/g.18936  ORF Transcript_15534/g.18936 Transcript_15534/m.18936 type:complete len:264 (+) Transcript_15534:307-1098(+)
MVLLKEIQKMLWVCICLTFSLSYSFAPLGTTPTKSTNVRTSNVCLNAVTSKNRDTILNRNGPYFRLQRFSGKVSFGSTLTLKTNFQNGDLDSICDWLKDEKRVALSIWDEKMIKDLGNSVYRLQIMTLQFVTIRLTPSVDTKMWIEKDGRNDEPVFKLQSINFDPNIELMPGLNIPAESLGIQIEVVGELRPSRDGKGVEGKIGFVSGGELPGPMRLLPEPALKSASDLICKTVGDFAVMNFQNGARAKYKQFCMARQKDKAV